MLQKTWKTLLQIYLMLIFAAINELQNNLKLKEVEL